jgi:hypothetical protein
VFTYTDPKERLGDIQTPPHIADFLYKILKHLKPNLVVDPACGCGNLLIPWHEAGVQTYGIEIKEEYAQEARQRDLTVGCSSFESWRSAAVIPDLVLCNAPWNRHWRRGTAYPEIFLRKIVEYWGNKVPVAFLCPMGFRLNTRIQSKRWKWLISDEAPTISSIISCPRDLYPSTMFHSEIILFNCKKVKPHYFVPGAKNDSD